MSGDHDAQVAMRIRDLLLALDEAEAKLAKSRKVWRARLDEANSCLRVSIETDAEVSAKERVDAIAWAWQRIEETLSGMKDAVQVERDDVAYLRKRLKEQLVSVRQLTLFDDTSNEEKKEEVTEWDEAAEAEAVSS